MLLTGMAAGTVIVTGNGNADENADGSAGDVCIGENAGVNAIE